MDYGRWKVAAYFRETLIYSAFPDWGRMPQHEQWRTPTAMRLAEDGVNQDLLSAARARVSGIVALGEVLEVKMGVDLSGA